MKLKIFADPGHLDPGREHIHMLIPFWGPVQEDPRMPFAGRFARYAAAGQDFFTMTPPDEADALVYPQEWRPGQTDAGEMGKMALDMDKPLIVFFNNDSDEPIRLPNAIVFRTSFYRSTRKPHEFAVPGWSEDFIEKYLGGHLELRQKQPMPVVSYCGYGPDCREGGAGNFFRKIIGRGPPPHPGRDIRSKALLSLSKGKQVATSFIFRRGFWGDAFFNGGLDPAQAVLRRHEYVMNMVHSDYVLCARGRGNFSYRLYEALCSARVPVLIDTDCVLPFDDEIDWHKLCVWVDCRQVKKTPGIVAEFHRGLTATQFEELQRACRHVWETHISPQGFFANMAAKVIKALKKNPACPLESRG